MLFDIPLLIVSDLDGTYLDSSGRLPACAPDFHRALVEKKVEFAVATSRYPHSVAKLIPTTEPYTAICSDGATTIRVSIGQWSVLDEMNIEPSAALTLSNAMRECHVPVDTFLFTSSALSYEIHHYGDPMSSSVTTLASSLGELRPLRRAAPDDQLSESCKALRAISWFALESELKAGFGAIESAIQELGLGHMMYAETRCETELCWLDVVDAGVSKGAALSRFLGERKRSHSKPAVWAFGNGDNDVSMFTIADVSFCPKDGSTAAKAAATYVIDARGGDEFLTAMSEIVKHGL